MWVGGAGVLLYSRFKKVPIDSLNIATIYGVSIISVIIVGIFWELFEFSLDTFVVFQSNDTIDTLSDLAMDVAGALLASVYIIRKKTFIPSEVLRK